MQPMVMMELIMELITSIYIHGHTKWLFSETYSKVRNRRKEWTRLSYCSAQRSRGICEIIELAPLHPLCPRINQRVFVNHH
jgi:3'-phosphoadenosine 5'-phosphosulfate sulfotransferase (PAPS reductase)/FAD synthetase